MFKQVEVETDGLGFGLLKGVVRYLTFKGWPRSNIALKGRDLTGYTVQWYGKSVATKKLREIGAISNDGDLNADHWHALERYAIGGVDTSTVGLDVLLAVVPGASAAKGGVRAVLQALAEARAAGASAKSAAQVELGSAKAIAEARAGEASAQGAAPGELGSAKAIEDAPKATSLTTITDEMNADPYHPDWQRYVGGEPRAVGADVVSGGAKGAGAAGSDVGKVVTVSKSRFPESAPHIEDAIDAGKPDTLTIDRANTASNRRDSLRGIETKL
ncbi:hypothetical protein [Pseudomonas eucalypticola]|uniref:Uncharacterized protein n=1 Tax=Pseudomonas eucalypticola TaxID=2599595 RepID=A0A7D5D768_9PSED|nr:hypothetical protein [Pseudomonas eucalypticola]QKZ05119.1 hypothetical protein HWQ56_15505 [Pseudomonas eucalypticola]